MNISQENERRKPWLPSTDIRAFDDIFSNALDKTEASELASGAGQTAAPLASILAILLVVVLAR